MQSALFSDDVAVSDTTSAGATATDTTGTGPAGEEATGTDANDTDITSTVALIGPAISDLGVSVQTIAASNNEAFQSATPRGLAESTEATEAKAIGLGPLALSGFVNFVFV